MIAAPPPERLRAVYPLAPNFTCVLRNAHALAEKQRNLKLPDPARQLTKFLDRSRCDVEGINVKTRVRLVKHDQLRIENQHLQNLVPLFLASAETVVQRTIKERRVQADVLDRRTSSEKEIYLSRCRQTSSLSLARKTRMHTRPQASSMHMALETIIHVEHTVSKTGLPVLPVFALYYESIGMVSRTTVQLPSKNTQTQTRPEPRSQPSA